MRLPPLIELEIRKLEGGAIYYSHLRKAIEDFMQQAGVDHIGRKRDEDE